MKYPPETTVIFTLPGEGNFEIFTRVRMTHPGSPGKLSGPPEHCYPPEPPEFEIIEHEIPDEAFAAGLDPAMLDDIALELAAEADWTEH